jgi:hypothetical protein
LGESEFEIFFGGDDAGIGEVGAGGMFAVEEPEAPEQY